eukprot:SAG31_NODE_1981_length_6745_cov_84.170178_1_plen_756_part_00
MARTAAKHPQRPPTGMAAGTRHRDSVVDDLAPRSSLSILLPQPGAATQPAQRRLCGGAENADASSSTLPHAHGTRPGMQAAVLAIKTHSATVDRQRVAEEQQLGSAAAHVADAFRGETDTTLFKRPELQKLHLKMMWLRYVFMYIYLVIALVEVPNWCYEEATCTAPDGQPVPTFGLPVLPRTATQTVEFLCICFFTVHLAVKFLFVGGTSFWASRWNYLKVVLLLVSGIDIVIFTAADLIWPTVSSGQPRNLIRLAPFLRPVVVAFIDGHTREDVVRLASTIWAVRHVLALIVVLVLWFGLVLFVLFNQFCPGPPLVPACDATISGDAVGADFNTIDGSSLSVFIMLTTSNFPIIMMQVYSFNRLFAVPFIIFLLFGLFFLMNAVLANVYSAYKKQIKSRAVDFNHAQTQSLKMAFDLLVSLEMQHESVEDTVEMPSRPAKSPKNCISVEILRQLLAELRGFGSQSLQLENLDSVIAKVDVNADGFINREEFDDLCILLPLSTGAMQIEHQSQGRCCSSCGCFCLVGRKQDAFQLWLRELVHSINFLRFVQGVIIVNAITIYIEVATEFVAEVDSPRENHFKFGLLEAFELCFATCYILEMTAKLLVLGWARYWRSWRNTLDGMVSLSSAVVELAVIVTLLTERQVLLLRTIIYVRLLLVIRVFSNFAPFTQLFAAFFELVPLFGNLLKALFIMMCFFAQVSCMCPPACVVLSHGFDGSRGADAALPQIGVSWFGGKVRLIQRICTQTMLQVGD